MHTHKATCKHCQQPIFMGRLRSSGYGWQLDEGRMYGQVFCDAREGCHVYFYAKDRSCVVWFPPEGRVKDLDLTDMKDAIQEMSGLPAFTLQVAS